jgi:hypothetical protein
MTEIRFTQTGFIKCSNLGHMVRPDICRYACKYYLLMWDYGIKCSYDKCENCSHNQMVGDCDE